MWDAWTKVNPSVRVRQRSAVPLKQWTGNPVIPRALCLFSLGSLLPGNDRPEGAEGVNHKNRSMAVFCAWSMGRQDRVAITQIIIII